MMYLVLIATVLVLVGIFAYYYFINPQIMNNANDPEQNTPILPEDSVVNDSQYQDLTEPLTEDEEEERLDRIADEREALLAEQAALEAQMEAEGEVMSTTSAVLSDEEREAQIERQQEIEAELLELQNAEEYPPLPDPGV